MSNVIQLTTSEEQNLINSAIEAIAELKTQIKQEQEEIRLDKQKLIQLSVDEATADKKEKSKYAQAKKALDGIIKLKENNVKNKEQLVQGQEVELGKINSKKKQDFVKVASQTTAEKVFEENNIHYVIFDQQWWSVDASGDRMSMRINSSDTSVIKDLIFYDSDWEISNEQELKKLAKDMGRIYKHIVRDFYPPRKGIYNQMATIRNQWLKPIYDKTPHDSFRLLCLSIAGNNKEYADQLEKYVAYRYLNPGDVMIPNIDSCAIGGTGRDTFFNLIRTIFTDEVCGSAGDETFSGTHNGDLFGKMFVKVDEKNSTRVPIDKIKELTGSDKYRHRQMNKDAREAQRLFSFIFFRNGYTTTVKLAGTGSSGEDRRFEPIIARINLPRYVALYKGLINDINQLLDDKTTSQMQIIIKEWQRDYYKNEERIAEWLGHIILKHKVKEMTELLPLHGVYYKEMISRQQKGIEGFMPKFMHVFKSGNSNVINISDCQKMYEVAESKKCDKEWFKNELMYWLNTQLGWDSEEVQRENIYTWGGCKNEQRKKMNIVQNRLNVPAKKMFVITEFIDVDAVDDRGFTVGEKITIESLREDLK